MMRIHDFRTGEILAQMDIDRGLYEREALFAERILRAEVLLSAEQIEEIAAKHPDFTRSTTIWCD